MAAAASWFLLLLKDFLDYASWVTACRAEVILLWISLDAASTWCATFRKAVMLSFQTILSEFQKDQRPEFGAADELHAFLFQQEKRKPTFGRKKAKTRERLITRFIPVSQAQK